MNLNPTYYKNLILGICFITMQGPLMVYGQGKLPTAFLIGEYEQAEEKLSLNCGSNLLSVCNDSMTLAYSKWMEMLSAMEEHAEETSFDINGIKIWIHVFWNANGTLKNISFYPKPESKNMDFSELTSFFESFIVNYQIDLEYDECFQHYAHATFPTFHNLYRRTESAKGN